MAYTTFYDGVCFIEGDYPQAKRVAHVKADLSFTIGAQLKNLSDVKRDLASKVKNYNCNCLINFKYGQKSRWLAIDDVAFFGEGDCINLPQNEYQLLYEKYINKNQ